MVDQRDELKGMHDEPVVSLMPDAPEYRSDGWPLCPRCGEDELHSVRMAEVDKRTHEPRTPKPTDEMQCYGCQWCGALPTRAEATRL